MSLNASSSQSSGNSSVPPHLPLPGDDLLPWELPPHGSPFVKFALWVTVGLIVLALMAGGGAAWLLSRQHHLAEGYLFRGQGQLLYFHVQESLFGGGVAGTFYPADAACPLYGPATYHVSGEVTDTTLMLQDDETDTGSEITVMLSRQGQGWALIAAYGDALASQPPPPGAVFQPSSDAVYALMQRSFCLPLSS